ncbi:hypothetical protein TNIN_244521 [Trichonephila inaurata madagascariensis]|uniref:Uncharacterized protein n=1 Tax=Trichonephila inaurata madagascariensis TaxID=2747483 RepID=A0A8X7BQP9_9ARAC|nr:hypothetical protein TNIN_244521 [Trichonephila inaurata madagascariensis]
MTAEHPSNYFKTNAKTLFCLLRTKLLREKSILFPKENNLSSPFEFEEKRYAKLTGIAPVLYLYPFFSLPPSSTSKIPAVGFPRLNLAQLRYSVVS